jgi:hypothetical protein
MTHLLPTLEKKAFLKDDMVDIILNKKYPVSDDQKNFKMVYL